ncbi:MAG TPA: septum formation initiator family protein [Cytophagales bacterium]|nr:septum formation initiator family protein [Cytophagales bacterium]
MSDRIPKVFKSFYFIVGVGFLVWMLFFDASDLITQYKLSSTKSDLIDEKEYYLKKIQEVKQERKELLSNPTLLEKFARERYLMKKPSEDVFIVIDEKKEN